MGTALLSFNDNCPDAGQERSFWFMGSLLTIHADAAETNGLFSLVEAKGWAGGGPPMHVHTREDEFFYLLEGKLTVFCGDDQFVLKAGESGLLPRHVPHTFRVLSKEARWLVYITPGGFEDYFRTLGRPAESMGCDPNPPQVDLAAASQAAVNLGVRFV